MLIILRIRVWKKEQFRLRFRGFKNGSGNGQNLYEKNYLKTLPYAQLLLVVKDHRFEVWAWCQNWGPPSFPVRTQRDPCFGTMLPTSNGCSSATIESWAYGLVQKSFFHTGSVRWYSFWIDFPNLRGCRKSWVFFFSVNLPIFKHRVLRLLN